MVCGQNTFFFYALINASQPQVHYSQGYKIAYSISKGLFEDNIFEFNLNVNCQLDMKNVYIAYKFRLKLRAGRCGTARSARAQRRFTEKKVIDLGCRSTRFDPGLRSAVLISCSLKIIQIDTNKI